MKYLLLGLFLSVSLFSTNTLGANLNDIEYLTEAYPPYNYEKNGEVKGITVEILLKMSATAGQPLKRSQFKVRPWARGYRQALDGPMTMLFSMSRTKERESKFQWVGPILKNRVVVMARKSDAIKITQASDLEQYTVGAVLDDVGEQIIRSISPNIKVKTSAKPSQIAKKLDSGRINLWVYDETVAKKIMKSSGLDAKKFEVVYTLKETGSYYALSKDVPKDLVKLLQSGLDQLKLKNNGLDYKALLSEQ